jgi:Tfp pilus assembly protein FimT
MRNCLQRLEGIWQHNGGLSRPIQVKRDIAKPIVRRRVPSFRARRGVSITELTVSMVIVAATMAALAQLVSVAAQQRRVGEARRLAVQELANQAERVAALEWEEVAPGKLTGWTASDDLMQAAGGIATVAEVAGGLHQAGSVLDPARQRASRDCVADSLEISGRGGPMNGLAGKWRGQLSAPRGKSLVEMLVVISVMSLVLGTIAVTLTALFRVERQVARDIERISSYGRLERAWRADSHAATVCETGDECRFTLPSGATVRYWLDGVRLRRELLQGTAVEHRDSFEMPPGAQVSFSRSTIGNKAVAALAISRKTAGAVPPVRPLRLACVVDLHGGKRGEAAP